MKIINFFIIKVFFKKPLIVLGMLAILFLANYLSFTASRSIISTSQGYQELKPLNKKGNFISNLDPQATADFDTIKITDTKQVYNYLNSHFSYAFQTDGFVSSINNKKDMQVSLDYINKEAYKSNRFTLHQGSHLIFNHNFNDDNIPVVIGYGLAQTYPIGSSIKSVDPVTNNKLKLEVVGVLSKNTHRSNFYAPNSKNYFNFSILIPTNYNFIQNSNLDLQVNGLSDLVLLNTTRQKADYFGKYINKKTGLKYNFFSQQENYDYFKDYYLSSLKIICVITLTLIIATTCISVWNSLMSIRLMVKDFTINLLVGLSHQKLRTIFYSYFLILSLLNMIFLWGIAAFNRHLFWIKKESASATYTTLGLIDIDWLALLSVGVINIFIIFIIVEITLQRIKKIPISLGVLQ